MLALKCNAFARASSNTDEHHCKGSLNLVQAAQRKAAAEEGTLEEDAPAAEVEAELATLPDEAYIRTCATGDSDVSSDDEDDDDDIDISDDDDTDSAHGEPSVIADTQADEPMTQARNPNHAQPSKPIKS